MKHNRTPAIKLGGLLTAGLLALTACGSDASAEENGDGLEAVTIAIAPNVQSLGARAAVEQGLFEEHGLDVELIEIHSGSEAAALLGGGDAHFAHFGVQGAIMSVAEGHGTPITVPTSSQPLDPPDGEHGFGSVIVATDSEYQTPHDLENTQIGVSELGGNAYLNTRQKLEQEGVDVSTIEWVQIPSPQQLSAIQQGQISAAVTPEPNTSIGLAGGQVRPLFHSDDIMPGSPHSGYASNGEWAAENPETIAKVQDALIEANTMVNADRALAEELMKGFMDVEDEIISMMVLPHFAEVPFTMEGFEEVADRLIEFDLMPAENREKISEALFVVE